LLNNIVIQLFSRYWALSVITRIGVTSLTFRVTFRHRSRDQLISHRSFPIGCLLQPSLYSNGFCDIQWRMWRNGWHDLKRPLNKGQGHSFCYQSISHMRLPIGCQ